MRKVNGAEPSLCPSGSLLQWRGCRHHGFQKRQSNSHTGTLQEKAPRNVLFGDEHEFAPQPLPIVMIQTFGTSYSDELFIFIRF
jgi:hypothetical protein